MRFGSNSRVVLDVDADNRPLSVVMASLARNVDVSWGILNSAIFLAVLPSVVLVAIVWRFVVEGILVGEVKGYRGAGPARSLRRGAEPAPHRLRLGQPAAGAAERGGTIAGLRLVPPNDRGSATSVAAASPRSGDRRSASRRRA
jgi:hypothetical protein